MTEVLTDGAALGDRFVAVLGTPTGPGWTGVDALSDPSVLSSVAAARGTTSTAVAATLLFEQYAHRLVAPVLAALHRDSAVLDAHPDAVRVRIEDGVLRRIAFAAAPVPVTDPDQVLLRLVSEGLDPVADALRRRTRAGARTLRGAMANAVASSYLHLSWPQDDRAAHVADAQAWLDRVPGWAGLVDVAAVEAADGPWMYVRRATCCLAFRTTVNQAREQACCSSCPVLAPSTTEALFARATAAYAARHPH